MSEQGLFGKYVIAKADGTPVDPKARYFIMRFDLNSGDPYAFPALMCYANLSRNRQLQRDLLAVALGGEPEPAAPAPQTGGEDGEG